MVLTVICSDIDRWLTDRVVDLPRVSGTGHTANLHRGAVLLEQNHVRSGFCGSNSPIYDRQKTHHGRHRMSHRRRPPRRRSPAIHIPPSILPPNPRQDPQLLPLPPPPKTNPLDAHIRHPIQLLALSPLW